MMSHYFEAYLLVPKKVGLCLYTVNTHNTFTSYSDKKHAL